MLQGAKHLLNNLKPKLSRFPACFCLFSSSPLPILPILPMAKGDRVLRVGGRHGRGWGGAVNIQLLTPPLHYIPS